MTAGTRDGGPVRLAPPDPAGPPAATLTAFVDGLVRGGVRDAVVCPGSRSTPLALALAADPRIRVLVHLDERAGSFLALGIAKTARRPVAVAMTSGTAAVNAHPAVVEARYGRVPLVVLTADRPPELWGRSAPQTIDQVGLYGSAARAFIEMPVPEAGPAAEDRWRAAALRAAWVAAGTAGDAPAGPVHLDLPFREPLVPAGTLGPGALGPGEGSGAGDVPAAGAPHAGRRIPSAGDVAALSAALRRARRPLVVCGPSDDPGLAEALAALAALLDAPILADPLSGLRHGAHDRSRVLVRGDLLVRRGEWLDAHGPDLVLRLGGVPTSKPVALMLDALRPDLWVVDAGDDWPEPGACPATVVRADPALAARAVAAALAPGLTAGAAALGPGFAESGTAAPPHPGWCAAWRAAEVAAAAAVRSTLDTTDEPYEGRVLDALDEALPDGALLWLGSSMPIRDADAYLAGGDRRVRVIANRGANGIDGVVSSAIGAAAAHPGPVVLVVGDLSFLYDLNALVGARLNAIRGLTVILVDNDGGGIFSFLPQATTDAPGAGLPERFERLFGVAHGTGRGFGMIVEALGGRSVDLGAARPGRAAQPGASAADAPRTPAEPGAAAVADRAALVAAVREATSREGVTVIRYATERARNVELHRLVAARVREALGAPEALGVREALGEPEAGR